MKQHQHLNINSFVHFFAVNGYSFVSFPLQLCQKVSICYFSLDTTNTNKNSKKFVTIQHQCLNINSSVDFFSLKLVFLAVFWLHRKITMSYFFFQKILLMTHQSYPSFLISNQALAHFGSEMMLFNSMIRPLEVPYFLIRLRTLITKDCTPPEI